MITLLIRDQNTGEYTGAVALALPLSDVMETVERTRLVVALADVSIISVGAVFATYLVHRSFRSLRQIEGVAGRIAHGDLSARILVTEPRTTEVGSLQRAINAMLAQNETSFAAQVVAQERMTRFVSDASHELRTPLAAIRGYGELYRMGGVPPERQSEVMGRIEDEASRMGRLVEDLLQLARIDEGRKMTMERVDLTAVCSGALTDMTVLAPDRACTLIPLTPNGKLDAGALEAAKRCIAGLREARARIDAWTRAGGQEIALQVDGGVKIDNIAEIRRAGADTFVAGSAIFGKPDYARIIKSMREQIAVGETTAI